MMKKNAHWIFVLFIFGLASCNLPQSGAVVPATGGAKTWFDAPLDGSTLPQEPYPVVIHAYDPGGISQIEFSINGTVLDNLKPADKQGLSEVDYQWEPKTAGNFVLKARSQGKGGGWNSEASVRVTIEEWTATLPPTFTPTPTVATPTRTATPTLIPTMTFTPTHTKTSTPTRVPSTGLTFEAKLSTNQIYTGNCGTNQVMIQAHVSDTTNVKGITLFLKVKDQASGESTPWSEGDIMNQAGDGWYQRTVPANSLSGYDTYPSAWVLYQFVATGSGGTIIGRSKVYSDIALSGCGAPAQGITPVRIAPVLNPPRKLMPVGPLLPSP